MKSWCPCCPEQEKLSAEHYKAHIQEDKIKSDKQKNTSKIIIIAVAALVALVLAILWLGGFFSSMSMDDAVIYAAEYANGATADDVTLITETRDGLKKIFIVKFECEDHEHEVTIHARTGKLLAYTGSGEELYVPVG